MLTISIPIAAFASSFFAYTIVFAYLVYALTHGMLLIWYDTRNGERYSVLSHLP